MSEQPSTSETVDAGTLSRVTLVGAGPGPSGLLTLAAVDALNAADQVVLISADLAESISHLGVHARNIQTVPLPQLGPELLRGRTTAVVIPGDPLFDAVYAEFAARCVEWGLDVDVVPGVPMKTSMAEFAGLAMGQEATQLISMRPDTTVDEAASWSPVGSLVIAGTAGQLARIGQMCLAAGRPGDQDALITVHPGTPEQHSLRTTLADMGEVALLEAAPRNHKVVGLVATPESTVVVALGQAVERREVLNWYETKPLFGWRILIPRTRELSGPLRARLASHGAVIEVVPTMAAVPPKNPQLLDKTVNDLVEGQFRWVAFTTSSAVRALRDKMLGYGLDARAFGGVQIGAVGLDTIKALRAWGIEPDLVPSEQTVSALAAEFAHFDEDLDPIRGVLVPKADVSTEILTHGLTERGWLVEEVVAFRVVRAAPPRQETREAIKEGRFDAVVFTSASAVNNLVGIAGKPHGASIIAAIGAKTAEACERHGLRVDVVPEDPDPVVLADALAQFADRRHEDLVAHHRPAMRPSLQPRRGRPIGQHNRPREQD